MIHAGTFTQKKAQWERYLFPLKKSLVIHVSDPLQWIYAEPLVRAINRSVVALFRFDVQRADVPPLFVLNNFIREWGHRMVYNRDVMRQLLEKAGFRDVRFARPGESTLPTFRGVEHHGEHIPEWCNALESMTIEGTKP